MARKRFGIVVLATVTILAASALAQKSNEVAGLIGRNVIRDQSVNGSNIHFGDGLTYEANFSHQFLEFGIAGVSVEVPFIVDPETKMQYGLSNSVPKSFSAWFLTPAARINLFPTTAFSPWVSVGGGFGHFNPSNTLEFGGLPSGAKTSTQGVFEVGGGLDVRVAHSFKIRGEIRDLNSGEPSLIHASRGTSRFNNLYVGAGLVFRF
jgi:opacity protein-like surface antigen